MYFFGLDLSHMIHIIDSEHPWDVYSINSGHTEVITCLEWDQSGEYFHILSSVSINVHRLQLTTAFKKIMSE